MSKQVYNGGEDLFKTFCSWGAAASNNRLIRYAQETYGRSSQMGPRTAMWRWAFMNPEEAWPLYRDYYFERFPDEPQPTWESFLEKLADEGRRTPAIGGGARGLQKFCAKYGVQNQYVFHKGDMVQVIRRSHPLYQSVLIVEETSGTDSNSQVIGFIVNANGTRTQHSVRNGDVAPVGHAVIDERIGHIVPEMTKVPRLQSVARSVGTPLEGIEFPRPGDMNQGVRFVYARKGEDGERVLEHHTHDDFDTGLEKEIKRLTSPESVTMDVV